MNIKSYVFVSNSTKPTKEKANSREKVIPTNVSKPCLQAALNMGYEVFFGINRNSVEELECDLPVKLYDSHTYRSLTAISDNMTAIRNLSRIIKENNVEVIHCNTPVGGLVGRLCGKKYHVKHVIYTAHGFHFYKGAPFINRTIFKWAEQIMAHWTDVIITMNQEDYEAAQRFKLRTGGRVYKVHGVGITLSEYEGIQVDRKEKRSELGLKDTDIICISAGDIVARKNYGVAIEAIAKAGNPNLHYLICGVGPEKESLEEKAKELGISDQVHFLGFRTDVKELLKISDIFLFTSLQEGLPRSLMEAMAVGLPAVVSKIRGNVDLIEDGKGGYLCNPYDVDGFVKSIKAVCADSSLRNDMAKENLKTIKDYDIRIVEKEISDIYSENLKRAQV